MLVKYGRYAETKGNEPSQSESRSSLLPDQRILVRFIVFILAFIFFISDIPEITDADMAFQAEESRASDDSEKPFIKQYRLFHASFAQFCYTGAQIAIARYVKAINKMTACSTRCARLTHVQLLH